MRVDICESAELELGQMRRISLPDGRAIAIYNVDGAFYATDDLCTHGEASLSEEGLLDGPLVECSWHFGRFDVRTGKPVMAPCEVPLKTYPVQVADGRLFIETQEP